MAAGTNNGQVRQVVDGVTVVKRLEEDEYVFPSVVFELESERDEAVAVSIREPIPDHVSLEQIGFHQDLGATHWDVGGDTLEFERTLDPNEEYTTVYAFREADEVTGADLVTPPEAVEVDPVASPVPGPEPMTRSSAESPYQDSAGGENESDSDEPPTAGGVDLGESDVVADEGTDESGSTEAAPEVEQPEADRESPAGDALAEELASEIEAGEVSQESLDVLRASLTTKPGDGANAARLEQLEQDIASLRAYTNALETFLDDEGSAEEIIGRFENRLDEMEAELEAVRSETDRVANDLSTLESRVETVDDRVATGADERTDIADDVESLQRELGAIGGRVPAYDVGERFEDVESELEEVGRFVEKLRGAFE